VCLECYHIHSMIFLEDYVQGVFKILNNLFLFFENLKLGTLYDDLKIYCCLPLVVLKTYRLDDLKY